MYKHFIIEKNLKNCIGVLLALSWAKAKKPDENNGHDTNQTKPNQ
jgi:hypothetical protein